MARKADRENGIQWMDWEGATFELAVELDKPVFVYFYTIWGNPSHRFERETLRDSAVQALVNDDYLPVKVDITRRPDIFLRYNPGGWPSICLLTPRGELLLGRTLLGVGTLREVLSEAAEYYRQHSDEIKAKVVQSGPPPDVKLTSELVPEQVDRTPLAEAHSIMQASFDRKYKGFGRAPKYPLPAVLTYLLEVPDPALRNLAFDMLKAIQDSALHDYIDGGFFRLCTDEAWRVPQFEKLLEDNAMLLEAYLEAWRLTGDASFRDTAEGIIRCLEGPLGDEESGLFVMAVDAEDKDGDRSAYYGWTEKELAEHLDETVAAIVIDHFGVSAQVAPREFLGRSALERRTPIDQLVLRTGMDENLVQDMLDSGLQAMKTWRDQRPAPQIDGGFFVGVLGKTLGPLAKAALLFERPLLLQRAFEIADLIWKRGHTDQGCLRRQLDEDDSGVFLDDQVNVIAGMLELYKVAGRARDLIRAYELAKETRDLFGTEGSAGCWDRPYDKEAFAALTMRVMPFEENAGWFLINVELATLTGEVEWEQAARELAAGLKELAGRYHLHNTVYLKAVQRVAEPPALVDLVAGEGIGELRKEVMRSAPLGTRIRLLDPDQKIPWVEYDGGNGEKGKAYAIFKCTNGEIKRAFSPQDIREHLAYYGMDAVL